MAAVFVSYAREDRGSAECLARVLEGAGHEVWWDRRLDGGEEFGAEIEAALGRSDVVLVAWSKQSIRSRWVRDEAAVGGDTGRLVPVSIDGSLPPMGFRQFHTLDLSGWKGLRRDQRTAELLRSVERRLKAGEAPAPPAHAKAPSRRLAFATGKTLWILAAALVLLVTAATLFTATRRNSAEASQKPVIALLPFTQASSDPQLRELGARARDSLAHTFSQSGVPVRLLNSLPQERRPDFAISGELSKNADKVVATVRLDEVAHGVTVFSHRFEAAGDDVRDLPERIGAQMAGNLTWSSPMMMLDRQHPIDPPLLADLLQGADFAGDPFGLQAYQNVKRVAAKAPELDAAQIGVAFGTSFVLGQIPRDERVDAVAAARRATERGKELAPRFGDTYATWCVLRSETWWGACEDQLRAGRRVDPDAPFLNTFLSHLLRNVGRFDESTELTRLAYTHDVYVPTKIAWMLKSLEYSGDAAAAQDLYQQGARWWPEYRPMFFRNRLFGLTDRADFEAMRRLEQEVGRKGVPDGYTKSDAFVVALKTKSLAAARRTCPQTDDFLLNLRCMLALSMLGDQDGAYAIADKLYPRRAGRTPAETERIWLDDPEGTAPLEFVTSPGAAPMRRDPRYLQLAERTGLLVYWRSGRPPDFCRDHSEPICPALLRRR